MLERPLLLMLPFSSSSLFGLFFVLLVLHSSQHPASSSSSSSCPCWNSNIWCTAFSFRPPVSSVTTTRRTKAFSMPPLFMGKRKPSKSILADVDLSTTTTSARNKSPKQPKQQKQSQQQQRGQGNNISPALAEWAQQVQPKDTSSVAVKSSSVSATTTATAAAATTTTTFTVFESDETAQEEASQSSSSSSSSKSSISSPRRQKQSARKAAELMRDAQIQKIVQEIEDLLNNNNNNNNDKKKLDIDQLLDKIQSLLRLPTITTTTMDTTSTTSTSTAALTYNNLRQLLTAGRRGVVEKTHDYRLAWAGSDEAICHIGTGLHKVPLARLQEVFWSIGGGGGGNNRVQMLEVIRILGPFPNVKNTLQGNSKISIINNNNLVTWKITWDSMVDGAGKEILAGTQENVRVVDLHVLFCDPSILVAAVPPSSSETGNNNDLLQHDNKGHNLLVFVREDALEDKLEALRVA